MASASTATPNGSQPCPFTSITAALTLIGASTPGTYTAVYVEPGTYSTMETSPLTIPSGVTVQGDPATVTSPSQVVIEGLTGGATWVQVDGTLTDATVTCSGTANGTCAGVMVRLNQGTPVLNQVNVVAPAQHAPVACIDVDSFPGSSFTASITGVVASGCNVGLRASNQTQNPQPVIILDITGSQFISNATNGATLTPSQEMAVHISDSTFNANTEDGLQITASAATPATFSVSLAGASCGGAVNQFYCNGWYGIENGTSAVLDISNDQFDADPPTFPSGAPTNPPFYDLNAGPPAFTEACNTAATNACVACPAPSTALYVSATPTGSPLPPNGSSVCPFTSITAALAAVQTDQIFSIYVEAGTYSTAETFPLTIPTGVTVTAEPDAGITADQVVIDGAAAGGFPQTIHLEGTLNGVTVTDDTTNNGGVLIRMDQGSPVLSNCVLTGGPNGSGGTNPSTNAGITTNTAAGSFTAEVENTTFSNFAGDGIRITAGAGDTLTFALSGSDVSGCANDGVNITDGRGSVTVSVSNSTLHANKANGLALGNVQGAAILDASASTFDGNTNDGVLLGPVSGTATVTLGLTGCPPGPGGTGYDNAFYCNGGYGIENGLGTNVTVIYDEFAHATPTTGLPTPADLSNNAFVTGCNTASSAVCP